MAHRKIAIIIDMSESYSRGLVEGIAHYIRDNDLWEFQIVNSLKNNSSIPTWFSNWKGDGIIAKIDTPLVAEIVTACNAPTVDVCANRLLPDIPFISTDNQQISQLAAEHLIQNGYENLAFCGADGLSFSRQREEHFVEIAEKSRKTCSSLRLPDEPNGFDSPSKQIIQWLKNLPKPVGVFACFDTLAQQVMAACNLIGLSVPDNVAIIGVDNDPLFCELSNPPLSSVMPNTRASGYEAAKLLDKIMRGEKTTNTSMVIPPLAVVPRQSTDSLAVDDINIKKALKFIRKQAFSGINVSDVARKACLSRRVLELRFKKLLGRTPREEILQVRLKEVKRLLRDTKLPLYLIAEKTGFEHSEYLSVVFRRESKITPSYYRSVAQR